MTAVFLPSNTLIVKHWGVVDYLPVWQAMKTFSQQRNADTPDEIWLLQHQPVFTQGQAGKAEHILATGDIPLVQVDRGGQVTYHGPGQLIAYLLIDIKRLGLGVRQLVTLIEQAIVKVLALHHIQAQPRADAPGVYVASGAKIAQLGLRVTKGRSFHGLSLNVDMDMQPFSRINPCGYVGMAVTNMANELQQAVKLEPVAEQLLGELMAELGYNACQSIQGDSSALANLSVVTTCQKATK